MAKASYNHCGRVLEYGRLVWLLSSIMGSTLLGSLRTERANHMLLSLSSSEHWQAVRLT